MGEISKTIKRERLKRAIIKFSEGLFSKVVDLALISIFYNFEFMTASGGKAWKAVENSQNDLAEVNYQTIKKSLIYLKQKGLIQSAKEAVVLPFVTEQGKKKLASIMPIYDEKRIWDGRIYLVTYDLPVKKNKERNYLRNFLRKIGCGMLQESVWLTPYNPKKLLEEFVEENNLESDLILVSSLGKDGTVGGMDILNLMEQVYHLSEINFRYKDFLSEVEKKKLNKIQLIFRYLSILQDDPQLPFELLPKDWVGDEAYLFFKEISKKGEGN